MSDLASFPQPNPLDPYYPAGGFRLTSLTTRLDMNGQRLWSGVWREGTDNYEFLAGLDWNTFVTKTYDLALQGLGLVSFEVYYDGGQQLWAGAWREGQGGELAANLTIDELVSKSVDLLSQGLGLVDLTSYIDPATGGTLFAGAWQRGGPGAEELFTWTDPQDFANTWSDQVGQGYRLVALEVNADTMLDIQSNPPPPSPQCFMINAEPFGWSVSLEHDCTQQFIHWLNSTTATNDSLYVGGGVMTILGALSAGPQGAIAGFLVGGAIIGEFQAFIAVLQKEDKGHGVKMNFSIPGDLVAYVEQIAVGVPIPALATLPLEALPNPFFDLGEVISSTPLALVTPFWISPA